MWRPTPSVGDPDGDRFLVDIQSNVLAKLRHDLSSSMRLCASVLTLKRNPRQTRMDRSLHLLYRGMMGQPTEFFDQHRGTPGVSEGRFTDLSG